MSVQDTIEQIKRRKTRHTTEELDRLGWARYAEVRAALEPRHHGDYLIVEVDSGDYFLGKTPEEALRAAEAVHPDKAFCLIRIGYQAAHKLKHNCPVI